MLVFTYNGTPIPKGIPSEVLIFMDSHERTIRKAAGHARCPVCAGKAYAIINLKGAGDHFDMDFTRVCHPEFHRHVLELISAPWAKAKLDELPGSI